MTAISPLVSVIVPCFNEADGITALYTRVKETLQAYDAKGTEILLVDDGSSDATWQKIHQICATDIQVVGLRLSRNFGHQFALACGIEQSKGQRVLIIDADLQDPPELLHDMMAKMDEGYDVVYGHRVARDKETVFKCASAWLYYRVLNCFSEVPIPKDVGDFRLMSRKAVDALQRMPERVRFTRGMVSWLGFRQARLDYSRVARHVGHTHYSLHSMICFATEGLVSFSPHPLRLAIWLGLLLGLFSGSFMVYAFWKWAGSGLFQPFLACLSIFIFFQSLQWIMLGILGSYLGVILRETKQRPLYLLDERIN